MGVLLLIIGILLGGAAILAIIGMAVGDIQTMRRNATSHRRRASYRRRPFVSVIIHDDICDDCIACIRRNRYSKKEIILNGERIRGSLIMLPKRGDRLSSTIINETVRLFEQDPQLRIVEILRTYRQPHTLPELLSIYHDIVVAPFIPAREAFHITLRHTRWTYMFRPTAAYNVWRTRTYCAFRWLASITNSMTLLYIFYMSVVLYEAEYLQIYLLGFGVWMVLAISRYPHFLIRQKIAYILLAPVSLGYFALLAAYAPFSPLVRRIRAATGEHRWQSSHQSLA